MTDHRNAGGRKIEDVIYWYQHINLQHQTLARSYFPTLKPFTSKEYFPVLLNI